MSDLQRKVAPSDPITGKCAATGNPCGTDTWASGWECQCEPCQRYLLRLTGETKEQRRMRALRNTFSGAP